MICVLRFLMYTCFKLFLGQWGPSPPNGPPVNGMLQSPYHLLASREKF